MRNLVRLSFARAVPGSLALALAVAGPVLAQDLIEAGDPGRILEVAKGFGSAELSTDDSGDPLIRGRMEGERYNVFFYGCEGGTDCTTIQFWTFVSAPEADPMSAVNDWNRERRFGKAYIDGDGDVSVEMDVNLWGGVTVKNLDDTFDWWRIVMEKSRESFTAAPETSQADGETQSGGPTVSATQQGNRKAPNP